MRTLVISDFHLGLGPRHAVLELPRPRERLVAALADVERLVLLGDIVELRSRRAAHSMPVAEPVLRAIGRALDSAAEVVLVPGNHDRPLIRRWLAAHPESLQVETDVPLDASPELRRVADWLGPARTRVRYPGVSLAPGVFAMHGHYLDRHLLPDSSYGITRGLLGRRPSDGAVPGDYEPGDGSSGGEDSGSGLAGLLPGVIRAPLDGLADVARAVTMPLAPGRLLSPRLAPMTAPLLSVQLRHAALPALAHAVQRLGVEAETVIFGHVHRLGPLPGDEPEAWEGPDGRPRLFNCGSWIYEPLLLHRVSPPHPYWPGGGLILEDGLAPVPVGMLDDLGLAEMRAGRRRRAGSR